MNLIALRLHEIGLQLEGAGMDEIVASLGVAEREIERLQTLLDKGKISVWTGRRFYFKTLQKPADTPLAIIFNQILESLGQDNTGPEAKAMYERFYPPGSSQGKGANDA
jgi:hypothetical protein